MGLWYREGWSSTKVVGHECPLLLATFQDYMQQTGQVGPRLIENWVSCCNPWFIPEFLVSLQPQMDGRGGQQSVQCHIGPVVPRRMGCAEGSTPYLVKGEGSQGT